MCPYTPSYKVTLLFHVSTTRTVSKCLSSLLLVLRFHRLRVTHCLLVVYLTSPPSQGLVHSRTLGTFLKPILGSPIVRSFRLHIILNVEFSLYIFLFHKLLTFFALVKLILSLKNIIVTFRYLNSYVYHKVNKSVYKRSKWSLLQWVTISDTDYDLYVFTN